MFEPGHPRYGGRVAGQPNGITADLRNMIHEALENKGGVRYLERQADENPVAFLTLVGKILPQRIESNQPVNVHISIEEERREALREIEEAFVSLRKPQPALIEATATEIPADSVEAIPEPATPVVGHRVGRRVSAAPAARRSRY